MHTEEVGEEEEKFEEDARWSEEEYVEEEENAFEPEPEEPEELEERSKLAAKKGQQFWVFDPGAQNSVWVWECSGAIMSNGVIFRGTTNNHHHHR
jgi:hypothetical protein